MRAAVLAILAATWAGSAGAADLVVVAPEGAVVVGQSEPLEIVRHVRPRIGRDAAAQVGGTLLPTIEWRRPVEVRVRTESGAPLTEAERRSVRDFALACNRGEVVGVEEIFERNGTYVVEFDCAWLQGFEGRVAILAQ